MTQPESLDKPSGVHLLLKTLYGARTIDLTAFSSLNAAQLLQISGIISQGSHKKALYLPNMDGLPLDTLRDIVLSAQVKELSVGEKPRVDFETLSGLGPDLSIQSISSSALYARCWEMTSDKSHQDDRVVSPWVISTQSFADLKAY